MQIKPASFAFTLLLGFLAAVPYSGIDINLPALASTGATLGVPSQTLQRGGINSLAGLGWLFDELNASAVTSFAFDFVVCQGVVAFECSGWPTGCPTKYRWPVPT